MDWAELLDVVVALHRSGMSVPMALEQHAYFGSGPSRRLAEQWLAERQISGDAVQAMRSLSIRTKARTDRFAAEMLTICLEYPASDHGAVLSAAIAQVEVQSSAIRRTPRAGVLAACAVATPVLIESLRALMAVVEA